MCRATSESAFTQPCWKPFETYPIRPLAGRRKEKRKLAETPSMLDPSQLAAKKQQPSDDMKATSPAIVIVEEASSGAKSAGNIAENATRDASRGEQNATPTPKARTTPKNHRKKPKTTSAGSGVDRSIRRSNMALDVQSRIPILIRR